MGLKGRDPDEEIRALLLGFPVLISLAGWLLIILRGVSPISPEPTYILDLLVLTGYVLLAVALVTAIRTGPFPFASGSAPSETFFKVLWIVSVGALMIGFFGLLFTPLGLRLTDAAIIYAGTAVFGMILYPSAYAILRRVPKWRRLTLVGAAIYTLLASVFLYLLLFSYRGFW